MQHPKWPTQPLSALVGSEAQVDVVMISTAVVLSFVIQFAAQILAVVVGLWIWNRWPALAAMPRRTPR